MQSGSRHSSIAHVHMVVRVHDRVIALLAAQQLDRPIRQHLVHVHVVRCAGSRLKRIYDELIHEAASQHLISRALYCVCYARVERAQRSSLRARRLFLSVP